MSESDNTALTFLNDSDALRRALLLPEVLNNIFAFCSAAVLVKCALISRLWSDVALDCIWRNNPPFMALIKLLAPVETNSKMINKRRIHNLEFERVVKVDDWKRFISYARRVRSFDQATTLSSEPKGEADSIFYTLALSRPTLSILPNLDELDINGGRGKIWLRSAGLFLRPELSTIRIITSDDWEILDLIPALFQQIADRSNLLTKLVIRTPFPVHSFINDLERLLTGLQRLCSVFLPPYMMTSRVLDVLATLPDLTVAYSNRPVIANDGRASGVANLQMKVQEGSFSSLCTLRLQGSLANIASIAHSSHGFAPKLETFDIDIVSRESELSLQLFLDSLVKSCPDIQTLRFHLPLFMDDDLYRDVPEDPITYGTLATITKWKRLKCFSLSFVQRVDISDHELVSLLSECEKLQHLDLNCEPWSLGMTALTLGFMSLLPATCQLETLSVYVDATQLNNLQMNSPRLRKLKKLCLGTSPLGETGRVALYLSGILPEQCVLDVNPKLPTNSVGVNHPSYTIMNMSRDRRKKWESTRDMLSLLLEARSLERQSVMRALRGESLNENLS